MPLAREGGERVICPAGTHRFRCARILSELSNGTPVTMKGKGPDGTQPAFLFVFETVDIQDPDTNEPYVVMRKTNVYYNWLLQGLLTMMYPDLNDDQRKLLEPEQIEGTFYTIKVYHQTGANGVMAVFDTLEPAKGEAKPLAGRTPAPRPEDFTRPVDANDPFNKPKTAAPVQDDEDDW